MTIRRTAYETRACHGFVLHRVQNALKAAEAVGALKHIGNDMWLVQTSDNAYVEHVPSFAHPVQLGEGPQLASDIRIYGKFSRTNGQFEVVNATEAELAITRMRLNKIWLTEDPMYLRNMSALPTKVYASWISEGLRARFALEPGEQMALSIYAAIFYMSNFTNETNLDEDTKLRLSGGISRELSITQTEVLDMVDKMPVISSVEEFCKHAGEVTGSVRLQHLDVGMLYASTNKIWFGANDKEILTVALEHPPTWLALLRQVAFHRSYNHTILGRLYERHSGRGAGELFIGSLVKLANSFADVKA
jgi:hypothetical protein